MLGLTMGAYHFFSFDSSGGDRLAYSVQRLPPGGGVLSPAVDVRFYGGKVINPPNLADVGQKLVVLLKGPEGQYGMIPVIYVMGKSWNLYIRGRLDQYPLWICNAKTKPHTDGKLWLLWQYTNHQHLAEYGREETFIDINMYCGNHEQQKI